MVTLQPIGILTLAAAYRISRGDQISNCKKPTVHRYTCLSKLRLLFKCGFYWSNQKMVVLWPLAFTLAFMALGLTSAQQISGYGPVDVAELNPLTLNWNQV